MKPISKERTIALRVKEKMTWIEIWRDTMCGQMPSPSIGSCMTPDGIVDRGEYGSEDFCKGCRYSNNRKRT